MTTNTTNLLIAVNLSKKFDSDWRKGIATQLRVNTLYPFGCHPGRGNRAQRRLGKKVARCYLSN